MCKPYVLMEILYASFFFFSSINTGWRRICILCTENSTVYIKPSLVASSLPFAFSSLATQATNFRPRTLPPPVTADLIISVTVTGPDSFHLLSQRSFVFSVNLCEGDGGIGLAVYEMPQPGLALDNTVGSAHFKIQDREEDNQPNGIHIMCSHYQLSLLVLHQGGDSINPCSKNRWPLSGDIPFAGSFFLRWSQQSLAFCLTCTCGPALAAV